MHRWILTLLATASITVGVFGLGGCGDDAVTTTDGGTDAIAPPPPPNPPPPNPPPPNPPPPPIDGGPDACTFATYVINLINTQTNATSKPDPTLGQGCKETTTQADFKALFP